MSCRIDYNLDKIFDFLDVTKPAIKIETCEELQAADYYAYLEYLMRVEVYKPLQEHMGVLKTENVTFIFIGDNIVGSIREDIYSNLEFRFSGELKRSGLEEKLKSLTIEILNEVFG